MANWISSKLKVAETFLQQIDQQAADSLGKNEKPRSEELSSETSRKSAEVVPLKDQLKKKKTTETHDSIGKLRSDHNLNSIDVNNSNDNRENKEVGASVVSVKPSVNPPKSGLSDSDWTELLSVPSQLTSPAVNRSNGVSGIRGLRKDGQRKGNSGSDLSELEVKRNQKSQNKSLKTLRKSDSFSESKINGGRQIDGEDLGDPDTIQRISSVELGSSGHYLEGRELDRKDRNPSPVVENNNGENEKGNGSLETSGNKELLQSKGSSVEDGVLRSSSKDLVVEKVSVTVDGSDLNMRTGDDQSRPRRSLGGINESHLGQRSSPSVNRESPSISDGASDSETNSTSTSDSESEREREERKRRRAQILAEKAVAKAVKAIKEREDMVAKLEGEKESLEKILEERAKQQAQEASELQNTMMETMDAVDVEKQKHNNTRMEALARLAKLETTNADLARSLATAQWNLEEEV
ncbi:hypothetical protein U1Q18_038018 [Sarracenia purpurea var. burkii]